MTTYRLFPATNGPASPVAFSGNFIAGVTFAVAGGGNWFDGYWWWVANSGQSTSAVKCALWSVTAAGSAVLVPGSVVTSGTLSAGQWNYIPLATPLQLSPGYDPNSHASGSSYVAAIGVNGAFPDTSSFWGAQIVNGPLVGYAGGGTPYGTPQGCFSTGGTDPSTTFPASASGTDNFWVDVQIDTVAPASYTGSYRLWPNKSDASPGTSVDDAFDYDVATEIHLTQTCTLNAIHYFSCTGAASLATAADVWSIQSQTLVATIASPTWLTESGGAATAAHGWVKAAFAANTTLPAGSYRVGVYNANGTGGGWNPKDLSGYFTVGVANAGITWGPLTAPNFASAASCNVFGGPGTTNGQPVFSVGPPDQYPNVSTGNSPAQIYWVDLEVTPVTSSGLLLSCFP